MTFFCPDCKTPNSLIISASIELPPDAWWDELTLQIVECRQCGLGALGVYQESRRGALDSEVFHHSAYRMETQDMAKVRELINRCPAPHHIRCTCEIHQELAGQDAAGHWNALGALLQNGAFELRQN
jgi:Zn ribbon nucleic-acid-binding protein